MARSETTEQQPSRSGPDSKDAEPGTMPSSSRWWLWVQAAFWRNLMRVGMYIHRYTYPRPPLPSFTRTIPFASGPAGRKVVLHFYCPPDYEQRRQAGERFPIVVNFHGGGFVLGSATDDSRWAMSVLHEAGAVFVSVEYRLAPEYPFPAAVDDGVEALLYLATHASDLGLDASRIVLSGFSAGGNLAVTVPLRLRSLRSEQSGQRPDPRLVRADSQQRLVNCSSVSELRILALFCWYPILDYEQSRDHRRAMSSMPNKCLPAFFTTLFDESYLPTRADRASPYASPVLASDELLAEAMPHNVFLYMCEWDMLVKEGQLFVRRLEKVGKKPRSMMIERAPHGWDKSPNPWRDQEGVNVLYRDACAHIKAVFEQ